MSRQSERGRVSERRQAHKEELQYYLKNGYKTPTQDIRVPGKIQEFLASRKPIFLGKKGEKGYTVIAPLNADGQNLTSLKPYTDTEHGKNAMASLTAMDNQNSTATNTPTLPTTYRLDKDSPVKSMIVTPQNQYTCGCCWAVSTATSASDTFVVAGYLNRQIMLSWTDLLTCSPNCSANPQNCNQVTVNNNQYFPSQQCGGGNFISAAQWAQNKGLVPSACLCFNWCSSNSTCTAGQGQPQTLNALIPPCTSCASSGCQATPQTNVQTVTRFYVKNVATEALPSSPTPTAIQNHQSIVQNWIMQYGGVTATFIVLQNLMVQGTFVSQNNPSGVYLEFVGNTSTRSATLSAVQGAHAVSVIGWSVDPIHWSLLYPTQPSSSSGVQMDSNGFVMVPNWVVRNSWGTSWNQGGYFQIACYPYNTTSQLDMPVQLNGAGSGGMVLMQAGTVDYYPDSNPDSPQPSDFKNTSIVNVNKNLLTTTQPPATTAAPPVQTSAPTTATTNAPDVVDTTPTPEPDVVVPQGGGGGGGSPGTPVDNNIEPPSKPEKSSSFKWTPVLITISVVCLLGVGGYFLYKKYHPTLPPDTQQSRQQTQPLLQSSSSPIVYGSPPPPPPPPPVMYGTSFPPAMYGPPQPQPNYYFPWMLPRKKKKGKRHGKHHHTNKSKKTPRSPPPSGSSPTLDIETWFKAIRKHKK